MKGKISKEARLSTIIELLLYNKNISLNTIRESYLYDTILKDEYNDDSTDIAFKRLIERDLKELISIKLLLELKGDEYTLTNKFQKMKALIIEKMDSFENRELTHEEYEEEYLEFSDTAVSILDLSKTLAKETTAFRKILKIPGMVDITCMQFQIHNKVSVISSYFYMVVFYKNQGKEWKDEDRQELINCIEKLSVKLARNPNTIFSYIQKFGNLRTSINQGNKESGWTKDEIEAIRIEEYGNEVDLAEDKLKQKTLADKLKSEISLDLDSDFTFI